MCIALAYMLHYIASGNRLASVFPVFNHIPGINVASPVYSSSQHRDRQVQVPAKHGPSLLEAAHWWTAMSSIAMGPETTFRVAGTHLQIP